MSKPLVIVESPYAGDIERNMAYARAAMRDCLTRGEAPLASHVLYAHSGVLDDLDPVQRQSGIDAGLAWGRAAHLTAVYVDLGISRGMEEGIAAAHAAGCEVVFRSLPAWAASA